MPLGQPPSNKTHGESAGLGRKGSPEYVVWMGLKARCGNPRNKGFSRYGGRGIVVCERWLQSFEAFLADVGRRPSAAHTLDRIDNDRGYEPGNVRWATRAEQAENRHTNVKIAWRGETLTVQEWARRTGLTAASIYWRVHHGWDAERALTTPSVPTYTHNGQTLTLRQWSALLGVKVGTLQYRLHRWPLERALSSKP